MFDYVIVGGGSAGCILASRLSEDPAVRVLLIEAGPPDDDENLHTPLGYLKLARTYDWRYESEPEERLLGKRTRLPRGRVLGGCSSVNAMIHIRGTPRDFEEWGVPGWGWEELLPYFMRCEDNERGRSPLRGVGGPVSIADQHSPSAVANAFVQAGREAGIARNEDFNGDELDGIGLFQVTQRHGRRDSAADAYLRPAAGRNNLSVLTGCLAERILFEGNTARGVRVAGSGGARDIGAASEVIISAGAYNSPQLLMLSGVGGAEHLREHAIEVVADRPAVGENLADHMAAELLWTIEQPAPAPAARRWKATQMMLAGERGPHTSNLAEAAAFLRLEAGAVAPDIQFHTAPVFFAGADDGAPEPHGLWLSPCLLRPASRGTVRLASADPSSPPVIDNAFCSAPKDMELLAEGVRAALALCARPALEPWCAVALRVPEGDSEDAIREHVRRTAFAFFHPVGTCRMGLDEDAVVDGQLRVVGTERLRVADASVMPLIPRANTNAAVMAVAERAAELIAADRAPAGRPVAAGL